MKLSPKMKTQLIRVTRLFLLSAAGSLAPFVAGLHGTVTYAAIQAAVVIAGEAGFRTIFPTVEAYLAEPASPAPAAPPMKPVPPAVF